NGNPLPRSFMETSTPVYVLDLGFVLPLSLVTAVGFALRRRPAERIALSVVVFVALMAMSILLMAGSSTLADHPLQTPMVAILSLFWLSAQHSLCAGGPRESMKRRPVSNRCIASSEPEMAASGSDPPAFGICLSALFGGADEGCANTSAGEPVSELYRGGD